MTCNRKHPCEAEIGENPWLVVIREEPPKLNAPLHLIGFEHQLLRAGQLLVPGYLTHRFSEAASRKSCQHHGIEVFRRSLCAQLEAYRWVRAHTADSTP